MNEQYKQKVVNILNKVLELELAGIVRYTHYSLMAFAHSRLPITSWLQRNASESLAHANMAGEIITLLGGNPSLKTGTPPETSKHDIGGILRESLEHEAAVLYAYHELLQATEGKTALLEEYTRKMIVKEELDIDEINQMLCKPGKVAQLGACRP